MTEAPSPRATHAGGGRQASCEKPRQFPAHWDHFLAALPTQVRRPLRDALNTRLSAARRRAALDHAIRHLGNFRISAATYSASVDEMMERRGAEYVDPANPAEAASFLETITPSGLRALSKRKRTEAAVAFADMAIARLTEDLSHGR